MFPVMGARGAARYSCNGDGKRRFLSAENPLLTFRNGKRKGGHGVLSMVDSARQTNDAEVIRFTSEML